MDVRSATTVRCRPAAWPVRLRAGHDLRLPWSPPRVSAARAQGRGVQCRGEASSGRKRSGSTAGPSSSRGPRDDHGPGARFAYAAAAADVGENGQHQVEATSGPRTGRPADQRHPGILPPLGLRRPSRRAVRATRSIIGDHARTISAKGLCIARQPIDHRGIGGAGILNPLVSGAGTIAAPRSTSRHLHATTSHDTSGRSPAKQAWPGSGHRCGAERGLHASVRSTRRRVLAHATAVLDMSAPGPRSWRAVARALLATTPVRPNSGVPCRSAIGRGGDNLVGLCRSLDTGSCDGGIQRDRGRRRTGPAFESYGF